MLWLTIKTDGEGIIVHHQTGTIGRAMSLYSPVHLLFVDVDGGGVKARLTDTGRRLLG
jgi:hypothetical protein